MRTVLWLSASLPALLGHAVASGQAVPPSATLSSGTAVFQASYFQQFAPRTALDIVRQVPGFTLELGDSDVRGFAGAAGNVVINGARPSSKAESLETTLARIPAGRVLRVEVAPGSQFGSEYSSKSQVLNIIQSAEGGYDLNLTASSNRLSTGHMNRNLSGSATLRTGASTFNLSVGTGTNRQDEEGSDALNAASSGDEVEFRRKHNSYTNRNPSASASWAMERGSDNAVRLNGRWAAGRFDLTQDNQVFPAGGNPRDDALVQKYRNPVVEIGGDVTRPLAGGAVKFVGLATRRSRDNFDAYLLRNGLLADGAETVGGFEQFASAKSAETIGRLSWSRRDLAGFNVEAGLEAALNTLDSDVELYSIGSGGQRTRINLPIDSAVVKEKRGEAYVKAGRPISANLQLDAGVNVEFSRLSVTGDTSASRSLRYFKPSLALDWNPGADWHARLSIRRSVAQLNFFDFISMSELANDRVNAGNAELRPQQAWEARVTVDRPILGDGRVKLDLGLDRVSMLQDQILTPEGFSAPGNLGTGHRRFAALNIDAPLSGIAIDGLRLKLNGQVQSTRVLDPISGTNRGFTGFFPNWQWSAELRRDKGSFSYGVNVQDRDRFSFFRANEIDTNWNGGPFGTGFVEWRPAPQTTIALEVENIFDTAGYRERLIFQPNRSVAEPAIRELRERDRHASVGLTVKQSLGGTSRPRMAEAET